GVLPALLDELLAVAEALAARAREDAILGAGALGAARVEPWAEELLAVLGGGDPLDLTLALLVLLERAVVREPNADDAFIDERQVRHAQARGLTGAEAGAVGEVEHEVDRLRERGDQLAGDGVVLEPRRVGLDGLGRPAPGRDQPHRVDRRLAAGD